MKQRVNWRDREYRPSKPKKRIHINILALAVTIIILSVAIALGILAIKGAWMWVGRL